MTESLFLSSLDVFAVFSTLHHIRISQRKGIQWNNVDVEANTNVGCVFSHADQRGFMSRPSLMMACGGVEQENRPTGEKYAVPWGPGTRTELD